MLVHVLQIYFPKGCTRKERKVNKTGLGDNMLLNVVNSNRKAEK